MTKRTDLMVRFGELIGTISTTNGYATDFEPEVLYWRDPHVSHGKNCLTYRDISSSVETQGSTQIHRIQVQVHAYLFGEDLGPKMNAAHDDIVKVIGTDRTLSSRTAFVDVMGSEYEINGDGYEAGLVVVAFQISHKAPAWSTV